MRQPVSPEVFNYYDDNTVFSTTDKELAVIVYQYAKKLVDKNIDIIRDDSINFYDGEIKRIKKEIKAKNESKK